MIVRSLPHSRRSQKLAVSKSPLPDASVLVAMFELLFQKEEEEEARPPRKYSTANFPLYQRTTLSERIATRGDFDEKSRHRPWIFFTSTRLKPDSGEEKSFPSILDEFLRLPFLSFPSFPFLSSLITFILDRREIEFRG